MQKRWLSVLAVVLALAACASLPQAGSERDIAAKQFTPPAGKSGLYIVRSHESPGELVTFEVFVDDRLVAELDPGMYQLVSLDPGSHKVKVTANDRSDELEIALEADKNAYCQVETKSGIHAAVPELTLLEIEGIGKTSVNQTSIAPSLP